MPKQFKLNVEDTNCAKIGSLEDKEARKAAAGGEPAWEGAGGKADLKIWRIEQFEVKEWPKASYGDFHEGDSYIVLHSHEDDEGDKLEHDIYFWLGLDSSTDEQGTAAYKTVELDDLLDGAATQHREVMHHESPGFNALFKQINYLKGGVESGFNHVEAGAYVARLLQVKKIGRQVNVIEVACARDSMNQGDAFILDAGEKIYVWKGDSCSPFEGSAAALAAEALEASRDGRATATHEVDDAFWEALGGEGPITSAEDAASVLPAPLEKGEGVLYRLSDAEGGELAMSEVGRGELSRSMLDGSDVFLCDTGPAILMWIGGKASARETAAAMDTANKYLTQARQPLLWRAMLLSRRSSRTSTPQASKPLTTSVTVIKEGFGKKDPIFREVFAN